MGATPATAGTKQDHGLRNSVAHNSWDWHAVHRAALTHKSKVSNKSIADRACRCNSRNPAWSSVSPMLSGPRDALVLYTIECALLVETPRHPPACDASCCDGPRVARRQHRSPRLALQLQVQLLSTLAVASAQVFSSLPFTFTFPRRGSSNFARCLWRHSEVTAELQLHN